MQQRWPHTVIADARGPLWRRLFEGLRRGVEEFALGVTLFVAILVLGVAAMNAPSWRPYAQSLFGAIESHVLESGERHSMRVIGGDTLEDRSTGERIRLANIDAAETGDRAHCPAERRHGEAAKRYVGAAIASARAISVRRTGRIDSYGRTVAYVDIDGGDLGETVKQAGLARPWRGHRQRWCGHNGALLP